MRFAGYEKDLPTANLEEEKMGSSWLKNFVLSRVLVAVVCKYACALCS